MSSRIRKPNGQLIEEAVEYINGIEDAIREIYHKGTKQFDDVDVIYMINAALDMIHLTDVLTRSVGSENE